MTNTWMEPGGVQMLGRLTQDAQLMAKNDDLEVSGVVLAGSAEQLEEDAEYQPLSIATGSRPPDP